MKKEFFSAIRLTVVSVVFFVIIYPAIIWGVAQATPSKGKGETVLVGNKVVGYKLEGQNFTNDIVFNGRPSAVGYNASGSGGSNKGPSNPEYLKDVQSKIDTFLIHNPEIKKEQIPSELVTSSGSGLDPDISLESAFIQVPRIAKARRVNEEDLKKLINLKIEKPLFGILGPEKVNVLQLNLALNNLK